MLIRPGLFIGSSVGSGEAADPRLAHLAADNLMASPTDFSAASYTKTRLSVSANAIAAPDGTLTADKLVEDASASTTHLLYGGVTTPTASPIEANLWLKAGERSVLRLRVHNLASTNYSQADFTMSGAGTASTITSLGAATGASAAIDDYADGWYRARLTTTLGAAESAARVTLYLHNGSGVSYTGNGTSGLYAWGFYVRRA